VGDVGEGAASAVVLSRVEERPKKVFFFGRFYLSKSSYPPRFKEFFREIRDTLC